MTELFIKPRLSTKEASFKGTVAAGEQVSVKIANPSDAFDLTGLRLRVIGNCGETLAQFPEPVEEGETPDSWGEEGGNVTCVLDLCTDKMLAAVPPRATVEFLFVLDDAEDGVLYFKDLCPITHWPMRTGEDVPKNVRDYRDFIAEANETIAEAQNAAREALAAAAGYAAEGNGILVQAQNKLDATSAAAASAVEAKNNAEAAVEDAQEAKAAAESAVEAAQAAQSAAESARDNIETPSTDLTVSGKAADAKTVGDRFAEIKNSMSAKADTSALNGLASQSSVNSEAAARAQADAAIAQDISDLSAVKADKSTTYTKEQVDAIVNALKNGRFIVATSLPTVANADKTAIYLIPNSSQQTNDVKDEYIVVGNSWEKIGNTQVDLSDVIKSVNDIGPDGNGNLQLGPSHIGAVPSAVDGVDGYVMTLGGTRYRLGTEYTESGIAGWGTTDGTWKLFVSASGAVMLLNNGMIKPTSPANVSGLSKPWTFMVVGIAGGVVVDDAGKITAEGLYAHLNATDNPHGVTAEQIGAAAASDVPTALSQLSGDSTHRTVTDAEKAAWNGKQGALTFDNAPTAGSANPVKSGGVKSALDGKVDKVQGRGVVSLGTADGAAEFADETGALREENGGRKLFFSSSGDLIVFEQTQQGYEEYHVAMLSNLPYTLATTSSGTPTANTRKVLKLAATTAQSVTLPELPTDDEVPNCDIVVDGTAATADFGLTLVGGTGVNVYYPDGEGITCKSGCVTMVSCVGINGLGWLVVGCNNLKTAS